MKLLIVVLVILAVALLSAPPAEALSAYCTAEVVPWGPIDVEIDYLPRVLACERGDVHPEALKAQAVVSRSFLYYKLDTADLITDSPDDQMYTCASLTLQSYIDAVNATSGEVLMYEGVAVCAFYVSGAVLNSGGCTPGPEDPDPTDTEQYVTYNWDKSGDDIEQSTLGFVSPDNPLNRGCMSQNGAVCLAEAGWDYRDILRFYYGMDIQIVKAEGVCILPVRAETWGRVKTLYH
jgi:hypothetical protein